MAEEESFWKQPTGKFFSEETGIRFLTYWRNFNYCMLAVLVLIYYNLNSFLNSVPKAFGTNFIGFLSLFWLLSVAFYFLIRFQVKIWKKENAPYLTEQAVTQKSVEHSLTEQAATQKLIEHRDSESQDIPYTYRIGRHANETLALRYGIANLERKEPSYSQHAREAKTIRLQKIEKIKGNKDLYRVKITDFRDREALAIIEKGTDYVKTFYPKDREWFEKYSNLEEALKGNRTMPLSEIARFHIEKTIKS